MYVCTRECVHVTVCTRECVHAEWHTLKLIDARGRIVQVHSFQQGLTLQRDQLAEGIYMVYISNSSGVVHQTKLLVQNL